MLAEYFRPSTFIASLLNTHFARFLEFNRERQAKPLWSWRVGGVIARCEVVMSDGSHLLSQILNSAFHPVDSSSQGFGEENDRTHLGLGGAINIIP